MRRVYGDFLTVASATVNVDGWHAPDSVGAYLALRVDADAICLTGQPVFGGIQYLRDRRALGGVVLRENPNGGRPEAPAWLGMMLIGLNLRRYSRNGRVIGALIQESAQRDPLLSCPDGERIDLRMAPLSAVAMMRDVIPSPARELATVAPAGPGVA